MKGSTLIKRGWEDINGFRAVAEKLVDIDDSHEDYEKAVTGIALSMSMGAVLKQKYHVTTGIVIGVVGTVAVTQIGKKFKKKDERLSKGELEKMGVKTSDV